MEVLLKVNFLTRIKNKVSNKLKYYKLSRMDPKKYMSFLEKEYIKRTGEVPNLDNPQKYTEKMQYAKINLNSSLKSRLSDKFAVRDWVKEKIGSDYLIPIYYVWKKPYQIKFDSLPNQYALKLTSGSGTNIIVRDGAKLNRFKVYLKFFD